MHARNAHIHIVNIDTCRRFKALRCTLERFDHMVELICIGQRKIPALQHAHVSFVRNADEQVYFRGTDIQTEYQVFFPYLIFRFIHWRTSYRNSLHRQNRRNVGQLHRHNANPAGNPP